MGYSRDALTTAVIFISLSLWVFTTFFGKNKPLSLPVLAAMLVAAILAQTVGVRPELRLAGSLAVLAAFALTILGPTFKLPEWALSISPCTTSPISPPHSSIGLALPVSLRYLPCSPRSRLSDSGTVTSPEPAHTHSERCSHDLSQYPGG